MWGRGGSWVGNTLAGLALGRVWLYQDFVAGSGPNLTLSDNDNGTGLSFDTSKIVDGSAVVGTDAGDPIFTNTQRLPAQLVSVSSHAGDSVVLSGTPAAGEGPVRVWFLYAMALNEFPEDAELPPQFVRESRTEFLDTRFANVDLNLSDLGNAGTARTNLGFNDITAGRVLLGDGGTLPTSDSLLFFDTTSKFLSVGIAAPTYRLHVNATADNYNHGVAISNSAASNANALWNLYTDQAGPFYLRNPNQTTTPLAASHLGNVALAGAPLNTDHSVSIRNITGQTTDHSLVITKLALQTGDLARIYDTDGTTVLAKFDASGYLTVPQIYGSSDSAGTINIATTSHGTKGKATIGTVLTVDEANLRVGINNASPSVKLHFTASSASETLITMTPTSGSAIDFRFESGAGVWRIDRGAGSVLVADNGGVNIGGTQAAKWKLQTQGPSTQTTVASYLGRDTGDPIIACVNSSSTANNFSGLAFVGNSTASTAVDSAIVGCHEVHTNGSETGHLRFLTRNGGGTITERMRIGSTGTITMGAYGAGLALFSSEGVISSLSGSSGQMLLHNGTTWAASNRPYRAGEVTIASGATTKAITFASAEADTDYKIDFKFRNTTDDDPVGIPVRIIAKGTGGFTVEWDTELPTGNYVGEWSIQRYYDPA